LSDVKEEAQALRIGYVAGYVGPKEIIAWADDIIAKSAVAEAEIIRVSVGGGQPVAELAAALDGIPGKARPERVADLVLRQMAGAIRRDERIGPVLARTLYQMYVDGLVSGEAKREMAYFDDAFDLAEHGAYGTVEQIQAEFVAFLSKWG
jgi:hypothetical protein